MSPVEAAVTDNRSRSYRRQYRFTVLAWIVLVAILVSGLVWISIREAERQFQAEANRLYEGILQRLRINEAVLEGLAAAFQLVGDGEHSAASRYAREILARYPHLYMAEAQVRVEDRDLAEFERRMRTRGHEDFEVRTFSYDRDRSWRKADRHSFYYPIVWGESLRASTVPVIGLDVYSVPNLRTALEKAIGDDTAVAASQPFQLVEGGRAYVLFKSVPHGAELESLLVSLVVRTGALIPADRFSPLLESVVIQPAPDAKPATANNLIQMSPRQPPSLLAGILPRLRFQKQFPGSGQPFVLTVERRLGWDLFDPVVFLSLAGISLIGFVFTALHARKRAVSERMRERAEVALGASEARYRAVVEDQTELICRWSADGRLTFVNEAYCQYFGKSREELIGSSFMSLIPEEDHEKVKQHFDALGPDNPVANVEHRVVGSDGEVLWQQWIDRAILDQSGRVVEFQSVGRDITEQKRAVTALQETEEKLKTLLENSPDVILTVHREGRILYINRTSSRFGREWMIGTSVLDYVPPEYHERYMEGFRRVFDEGVRDAFEHTAIGPTWWVTRLIPLVKDTEVFACMIIGTDITERKRAEDALRRAKDELESRVKERTENLETICQQLAREVSERQAAEAVAREGARQQTAVAVLGQHALSTNSLDALFDEAVGLVANTLKVEYCKVLQLRPSGGVLWLRAGVGWRPGVVGEAEVDADTGSQAGYTLLSEEPVIVDDLRTETRFRGPSLLIEHGVISGVSVLIAGEKGPFGVLGAHTQEQRKFSLDEVGFLQAVANVLAVAIARKAAEEAIRQRDDELAHIMRVATLGEMATGLAHEINQPLTAAVATSQACLRMIKSEKVNTELVVKSLRQIGKYGEQASEVIQRLRRLVQKRARDYVLVDINIPVHDAIELISADLAANHVSLDRQLAVDLPRVSADPIQIEQVLLNLMRNSIEAINGKGRGERIITLRTELADDGAVGITVSDTGVGVKPGDYERIFEAFVSIKKAGLGMGLAISRSIIEAHGGTLKTIPSPEGGATFQVLLPPGER